MRLLFPSTLFLLLNISLYSQQTVGLFLNDSLAQNGYTLLAPTSSRNTYLIDNCGFVVNSWQSAYPPGQVAYLLENGNLLRTARIPGSYTGGGIGGRIEIFDWDGNLLWGYNHASTAYHAHHDVEYLPNGNILLIAWEGHTRNEAIAAGRNPALTPAAGVWFEQIVEIKPVGTSQATIVWEWHSIDHLVQDFDSTKANYNVVGDHPELLDANFGAIGGPNGSDWVHFNSIDYNPVLDQIIVNSRGLSEFYIIDHSTTSAEAAGHTGGVSGKGGDFLYRWGNPQAYRRGTSADQQLWVQHDTHWIEDGLPDAGKIISFNNGQGRPGGNFSTVDVLIPPVQPDGSYALPAGSAYGPDHFFWTYKATPANSFFATNISGAQRLPNGNTLICEGPDGHIFEVDMAGNLRWDYINPVSGQNPVSQGQNAGMNLVFRAYRYTPDFPAFIGKTLTPGAPVELNPFQSNCQIFNGTTAAPVVAFSDATLIFPNPVQDHFFVENNKGRTLQIQVFDLCGQTVVAENANAAQIQIDLSRQTAGIYFVRLTDLETQQFNTQKIIKQ
jgi:hypothetical protein